MPVYDTQCGAKLFRVTPSLNQAFDKPFSSRWVFDVELIDRFLRLSQEEEKAPRREQIVEVPLQKWTDIAGSNNAGLDVALVTGGIHAAELDAPRGTLPTREKLDALLAATGRHITYAIGDFCW